MLRVVRALCAHDETLSGGLGNARATRAAGDRGPGGQQLPAQIIVQAPDGTLARTLDALRVRIIDGTASSWWDGYGHARAHHGQHGHLDVATTHVTGGGFRLGTWLTAQRAARNSGTLGADRTGLLDQIGMIWDRLEDAWMSAYQDLRAFRDQHGHFEVPASYRTAGGIKLAEWQGTQRDAGRAGTLTASRQALLEDIGFPWDPAEARWMRRYGQLTDALARHGGPANLPVGSPEATWLEGQHLAHHRGRLPAGKITLLEQAGIVVRRQDPWLAGYQALTAFKAQHGHLNVPDKYKTHGSIDLSDWLRDQRVRRKAGRITGEQARLLEEAGFCWDPLGEAWNARYREAVAWKHEHGHLDLPRKHPIREWLYRQQKAHRLGRLPGDRASLLRDLGVLEARAAVLELAFGQLGAAEACTEYLEGNYGSEKVSRKLGYTDNGQHRVYRDDKGDTTEYQLRLDRQAWEKNRDDTACDITGISPCLAMFGLPGQPGQGSS